ncbi:hypothetical protein [Microbacterium sp. NPDC077184]|uniref:DUF7169 domain-containing protein n=1 Tax=Microbacterium sp. NPDC077184 TaxID=3154764 RepID=UPI003441B84D
MATDPLADAVKAHASQVMTTADLACLRAARVQWEEPRIGVNREPNRAGTYGDPTFDIVANESRLAVRAAYLDTIQAFHTATAILAKSERNLRRVLAAYGEADDSFPERPATPEGFAAVAA